MDETSRGGVLGPRVHGGLGPATLGTTAASDPSATSEIRVAADPESDTAKTSLIEEERRQAEHGE